MLGTEPRWSHEDRVELERLSDWRIEADGAHLAVSPPTTPIEGPGQTITLGLSALDLPEARKLVGRRAQLHSRLFGRIGAVRVKSVSPELSLLTAVLETDA